MLWLCLLPTRLPLEALDAADAVDLAVVQRKGSRRWILDSRAKCRPGTDLSAALAIHHLRLVERQPEAERAALAQLACFAYALGTPVHQAMEEPDRIGAPPFHAVWVEISASLRLFGGLAALRERVTAAIAQQALTLRPGLGPTIESAVLAAQHQVVLDSRSRLSRWLQRQPLDRLRLPAKAIEVCRGSGLRTAGDILALPMDSLARRFGAAVPNYLRRLLGDLPDPRPSVVPPETFRRRFEMFGVIETKEGLLLTVRRILVELEHYLRARDTGVLGFTLELVHELHPRSMIDVGLAQASRDATHFVMIAKERLERAELPSGVIELIVRAEAFTAPDTMPRDLFDGAVQQQRDWHTVIEKLQARWGHEAVWGLGIAGDDRPEHSWRKVRVGTEVIEGEHPPRPALLLETPRPIPRPRLLNTPERIAGLGWWDCQRLERDYFIAEAEDGTRLWVYLDRPTQRWFLHGLWA